MDRLRQGEEYSSGVRFLCFFPLHLTYFVVMGNIVSNPDKLAEFCRKHGIRRLSLFGSVLREDFGPDSDVDVLVEFEPGQALGFFRFSQVQRELSELLGGRKVDLRTPNELSRYFRDQVLASVQVQYAAG